MTRILGILLGGVFFLTGCVTTTAEMTPPPALTVKGVAQSPLRAGLYATTEFSGYVKTVQTSPLDTLEFPLGKQAVTWMKEGLGQAFKTVVMVPGRTTDAAVDIVVEPSIVKLNIRIPMPAYNPYHAEAVIRATVYDPNGKQLFTQTVTGKAQASKGLMSGFYAQQLSSEVAQKALANAIQELIAGLADEIHAQR